MDNIRSFLDSGKSVREILREKKREPLFNYVIYFNEVSDYEKAKVVLKEAKIKSTTEGYVDSELYEIRFPSEETMNEALNILSEKLEISKEDLQYGMEEV